MPRIHPLLTFLAALTLAILVPTAPARSDTPYRDANLGWQINLPAGWHVADAAMLAKVHTLVSQQASTAGEMTKQVFVGPTDGLFTPQIIVQAIPSDGSSESLDDLENDFNGGSFEQGVQRGAKGNLTNFQAEPFDRVRCRAMATMDAPSPIGPIRTFMVVNIGSERHITLLCQAPASSWSRYEPQFRAAADSFSFDADKVYVPATTSRSARTAGQITVVAVVLGVFIIRKLRA